MKRLRSLAAKPWALPLLCYLSAAVIWLALGAVHAVADTAAKASGRLVTREMAVTDFALADLNVVSSGESGQTVLETTSNDPQMILEDVSNETVRTLQMDAGYEGTVGEMCLYYTTAAGQEYSKDRRVFPTRQSDGSYLYTLPRGSIVALRLDPCSPEENKSVTITIEKILLNRPAGFGSYFVPSWYQVFCLVLYPGLAAAVLCWAGGALRTVRHRKDG